MPMLDFAWRKSQQGRPNTGMNTAQITDRTGHIAQGCTQVVHRERLYLETHAWGRVQRSRSRRHDGSPSQPGLKWSFPDYLLTEWRGSQCRSQ